MQSLLAEITSTVSLLVDIGSLILSFLHEKKMSVNVIRYLFNIENKNKKYNKINSEKLNYTPLKLNNSIKKIDQSDIYIRTTESVNEETDNNNEKVLKSLHAFNVLKSYLCNSKKD